MAIVKNISGPNALAIEYQAMYRDSSGNLRFANGVDHSDHLRPRCVFGPGFLEKLDDLRFLETRALAPSTSCLFFSTQMR